MYKVLLGEKTSTLTLETAIKNNKKQNQIVEKKNYSTFYTLCFNDLSKSIERLRQIHKQLQDQVHFPHKTRRGAHSFHGTLTFPWIPHLRRNYGLLIDLPRHRKPVHMTPSSC